jgi:hypothetical protein
VGASGRFPCPLPMEQGSRVRDGRGIGAGLSIGGVEPPSSSSSSSQETCSEQKISTPCDLAGINGYRRAEVPISLEARYNLLTAPSQPGHDPTSSQWTKLDSIHGAKSTNPRADSILFRKLATKLTKHRAPCLNHEAHEARSVPSVARSAFAVSTPDEAQDVNVVSTKISFAAHCRCQA